MEVVVIQIVYLYKYLARRPFAGGKRGEAQNRTLQGPPPGDPPEEPARGCPPKVRCRGFPHASMCLVT